MPPMDNGSLFLSYLDPVVIGICNKGNMLHFTILKSLDKLDVELFKARACLVNIVNSHGNVTESASGLLVAVCVGKIGVVFGAPVAF